MKPLQTVPMPIFDIISYMDSCIIGKIADCDSLLRAHPYLEKAFAFLRRDDLASLPAGRHEIDGDRCWCFVNEVELFPRETRPVEAHRACIDIQSPLTGPETIGLCELDEKQLALPFDEKNDCVLFTAPTEPVTLFPGDFAVFFPPTCGHAPCCLPDDGPRNIRKVVVKVRKNP